MQKISFRIRTRFAMSTSYHDNRSAKKCIYLQLQIFKKCIKSGHKFLKQKFSIFGTQTTPGIPARVLY